MYLILWLLNLIPRFTIHLEHLVVQTTEHCFIQMELNQLQHQQLVLQQANGVDKMIWNVGKVCSQQARSDPRNRS